MDLNTLLNTPPWQWPTEASTVILETLVDKHANKSDRVIAARMAGELVVMDDEVAGILLAIVQANDEPEELRGRAAISLGPVLEEADTELIDDEEFDDPEGVPISLDTFRNIRDSLRKLYLDEHNSKELRRRILEASVRAPQDWHARAISAAYSSGDREWMLTAVFAMRWVPGFDDRILETLESTDPQIHVEAVQAAGRNELDAAWPHVAALVTAPSTPKPLRLAAIEAVGTIRPKEAQSILFELTESSDDDIAAAAGEAVAMAQAMSGEENDGAVDAEGNWIN
ncbi:MAG: hypothetical protein ACLQVL_31245 [Terriglobia bacterium]